MHSLRLTASVAVLALSGVILIRGAMPGDAACIAVLSQPKPAVARLESFATAWKKKIDPLLIRCSGTAPDQHCQYAADQSSLQVVRDHGWALFQELTALPDVACPNIPAWLTWKTKLETYPQGGPKLRPSGQVAEEEAETLPANSARNIFGSAHYSPGLDLLLSKAIGRVPKGPGYFNPTDLVQLGPPGYKTIDEFVVKPIWWTPNFHSASGPQGAACIPVWPYRSSSAPPGLDGFQTADTNQWVIFTDGSKLKPGGRGVCSVPGHPQASNVPVISLDEIFHVSATNAGEQTRLAAAASNGQIHSLPSPTGAPDIALLVGMHIISREVDSWTWNTYWWEPAGYRQGTEFSDRRPLMRGVWNNYVMNATLNQAGDPVNSQPSNAVYNPYQEVTLPSGASQFNHLPLGGRASNCLSCHQYASIPFGDLGRQVYTPSSQPPPSVNALLRIGFLWSFATSDTALENK